MNGHRVRNRTDKKQNTEIRNTCFLKKQVENAALHKSALNKIMITYEKCVKYDFEALLHLPNLFKHRTMKEDFLKNKTIYVTHR